MAKRRTALAHYSPPGTRPNIIVLNGGKRGGKRRKSSGRAFGKRARRRHARAIGGGLTPMTGLALGGAVVGYAQAAGWLDFLPGLGGSKTLAMGAAGYLATRMTKNKYVREAGAAAVAVAAFEFGREHGGSAHPAGKVHGGGAFGGAGPFGGV